MAKNTAMAEIDMSNANQQMNPIQYDDSIKNIF